MPEKPSQAEQGRHNITHLPPARWCVTCLLARSSAAPHASMPTLWNRGTTPQIQINFNFYTKDGVLMDMPRGEEPENVWATTLTCVDKATQNLVHLTVQSKSPPVDGHMPKAAPAFVRRMAYRQAEILTDGSWR